MNAMNMPFTNRLTEAASNPRGLHVMHCETALNPVTPSERELR